MLAFRLAHKKTRGRDGGDAHSISKKQNGALSSVGVWFDFEVFLDELDSIHIPLVVILVSKEVICDT